MICPMIPPILSRRSALQYLGMGAVSLMLPGCASWYKRASTHLDPVDSEWLRSVSSMDRSISTLAAPRTFFGDRPHQSHPVLWVKAKELKGNLSKLSLDANSRIEHAPVVIIGGGISGLTSAYLLKDHQPIVLENSPRFGGNSQGQSWNGIDYSLGAAYFMKPEAGSDLAHLLNEIGVLSQCRVRNEADSIVINGKKYNNFWDGESHPNEQTKFKQIHDYLKKVGAGAPGFEFPDLPHTSEMAKKRVQSLDRVSFLKHLESVNKGKLHPHVECAIEYYCWSALGGSASEVSAAAGLNFYSSEFSDILVAPGGNGAIAEALVRHLEKRIGQKNLRVNSIVYDVRETPQGVLVSYLDSNGQSQSIQARAVVMACPKFIAARLLHDIEPEREKAIRSLQYRSYLVANVLLNKRIASDFYDLFMLDEKSQRNWNAPQSKKRKVTDVILGSYAHPKRKDIEQAVITLYRPLPYAGARGEILADSVYEKIRSEFESELMTSVLPLFPGITSKNVVDLRIARWGHPYPLAQVGIYSRPDLDLARKPWREKVFFVQQDNWMLPAFETAVTEAFTWAPHVDKLLQGKV